MHVVLSFCCFIVKGIDHQISFKAIAVDQPSLHYLTFAIQIWPNVFHGLNNYPGIVHFFQD